MVETINAVAVTADWVLPGPAEGRILVGDGDGDADADRVTGLYLERGVERVVVKAGPVGATLYTAGGDRFDQPVFPVLG